MKIWHFFEVAIYLGKNESYAIVNRVSPELSSGCGENTGENFSV
jgi:hypothetical protein